MTTATLTETDVRIRDAVTRQLDWDPEIDASGVGVTSKGGAVTLTGYIDTYSGKLATERAAKRVRGVRAVANDIQVRLHVGRTDDDIARDVAHALELRGTVPAGVQALVHRGHLTLTGTVPWLFQREAAEKAVRHIRGVAGVVNRIEVLAAPTAKDLKKRITEALHRNADIDARQIAVAVSDAAVTLTGRLGSWAQREAAERAAMNAPGIVRVDDRIEVVPPER